VNVGGSGVKGNKTDGKIEFHWRIKKYTQNSSLKPGKEEALLEM
jgi:hypothetical protein